MYVWTYKMYDNIMITIVFNKLSGLKKLNDILWNYLLKKKSFYYKIKNEGTYLISNYMYVFLLWIYIYNM